MIEIKDLSKEFQGVPVLRGINETIRQGEKVAIIGPCLLYTSRCV